MAVGADCVVAIVCGGDVMVSGSDRGQDFMTERTDMETALIHYCNGRTA